MDVHVHMPSLALRHQQPTVEVAESLFSVQENHKCLYILHYTSLQVFAQLL